MEPLGYMAIDQYNMTYHIGMNPPRKWLLNHLCRQHAEKMYVDMKDSTSHHTGYVIAGLWLTIYRVGAWK